MLCTMAVDVGHETTDLRTDFLENIQDDGYLALLFESLSQGRVAEEHGLHRSSHLPLGQLDAVSSV